MMVCVLHTPGECQMRHRNVRAKTQCTVATKLIRPKNSSDHRSYRQEIQQVFAGALSHPLQSAPSHSLLLHSARQLLCSGCPHI